MKNVSEELRGCRSEHLESGEGVGGSLFESIHVRSQARSPLRRQSGKRTATLPGGESFPSRKTRIALISLRTESFPPLAPCPNESVGTDPNGNDGGTASPAATIEVHVARESFVCVNGVDESARRRRIGSVEPKLGGEGGGEA